MVDLIALHLAIRGVAGGGNHLVEIIPVYDLTLWYAPYPNLGIKRATDEVPVIYWIELDACHCPIPSPCKDIRMRASPEEINRGGCNDHNRCLTVVIVGE